MKKRLQQKLTETEYREIIHYQGKSFSNTQPFLKSFDECLQGIKENPNVLGNIPKELREDKQLVKEAVALDAWTIRFASPKLKKDKELLYICVKQNGLILSEISKTILENDRNLILEAIRQNGRALMHVPNKYKNDPEVVLEAVTQNMSAFQYASDLLKQDRDFVLKLLRLESTALKYSHQSLQDDKELVLVAVEHFPISLEFANQNLKNQKDIVLFAIKKDKRAFKYASSRLKQDLELILLSKGMYYLLVLPQMKKNENIHFNYE